MTETLLTLQDVADRMQVPVSTVMEWRKKYSWPTTKVGRTLRFTQEQWQQIQASHEVRVESAQADEWGRTDRSRARAS